MSKSNLSKLPKNQLAINKNKYKEIIILMTNIWNDKHKHA